jgi:hypothetical protein
MILLPQAHSPSATAESWFPGPETHQDEARFQLRTPFLSWKGRIPGRKGPETLFERLQTLFFRSKHCLKARTHCLKLPNNVPEGKTNVSGSFPIVRELQT